MDHLELSPFLVPSQCELILLSQKLYCPSTCFRDFYFPNSVFLCEALIIPTPSQGRVQESSIYTKSIIERHLTSSIWLRQIIFFFLFSISFLSFDLRIQDSGIYAKYTSPPFSSKRSTHKEMILTRPLQEFNGIFR